MVSVYWLWSDRTLIWWFVNCLGHHTHHRRRTTSGGSKDHHLGSVAEGTEEDSEDSGSEDSTIQREERDFLTNPYWIEDHEFRKGEVDFLSSAEILFWKDLIDKYLYPIDQDKGEQVFLSFILL